MSDQGADAPLSEVDALLGDASLAALFAGLHGPAAVLAVSGGPDSMALLHLAARWARSRPGAPPVLHVATVDHGLRPEAAAEAALVAAAAAGLGLRHATLAWTGVKPATRRQERARTARYALLSAHARNCFATHLLTAHHADDQAETVLMRLGRGSGVAGLAGMRRETRLADGVVLLRPLLAMPKATLVALCRHFGQSFAEDPTNADPRTARGRLRAEADVAARLGLDRAALLRLARRISQADAALEAETSRLDRLIAAADTEGRWSACLRPACGASPEILQRLLGRAVRRVGGRPSVRLDRLEVLADALGRALEAGQVVRATLAGTTVVLEGNGVLTVSREPARRRGGQR